MEPKKINSFELISTVSIITFAPLLVTLPRNAAQTFGTATVLHSIYIAIIIFIFFLVIFKLYKNLENKDIFDLAEYIGGKTLKIFTGLIFIIYLSTALFITVNEFSEDIKNVLFINTNAQSVATIFLIAIFITSTFGLKSIFRISSILFPIIFLGLIIVFFSLFNEINILNLFPILGTGSNKIFLEGLIHTGRYNSLVLLFLFAPKISNLKKTGLYSILSTTTIILLVMFLISTIIPYPEILETYFAFFEITRMIKYGRFFQRVELIFTFLWIFVSLIYLTLCVSSILYILKKAFNIEFPKLFLPLFLSSNIALNFIFPSFTSLIITREIMYTYFTPIIVFIYPLILLILSKIKLGGDIKCKSLN